MKDCPTDVITLIADYLSPVDASRLACCNKSLMKCLPIHPLQIRIISRDRSVGQLAQSFFVSERQNGRMLRHGESLQYGKPYLLWVYDADRRQRVELKRHLPFADGGHDIALEARQRTSKDIARVQTWEVIDLAAGNISAKNVEATEHITREVPWNQAVRLSVKGESSISDLKYDCSTNQSFLSAKLETDGSTRQWVTCASKVGAQEEFLLVPRGKPFDTCISPIEELHATALKIQPQRVFQYGSGEGRYYSARSLETGTLLGPSKRQHAVVKFELWTENGCLLVQAVNLHFSIEVPIVMRDREYETFEFDPLLELCYNMYDGYFWHIRYYMAVSADTQSNESADTYDGLVSGSDHPSFFNRDKKRLVFKCLHGDHPNSGVRNIPRNRQRLFFFLICTL